MRRNRSSKISKRIDELSVHQERNPTTVSQFLAQIQDLQNEVNSLSDAREVHDPESGSSSGATHVPSQPSTVLSPRAMARCDSGLPRGTRNYTGTSGNVFERPPAREGQSSTFCNNSKNLASSSQELKPDTTGTTRRRERERNEKRTVEYVNPFTTFPKRWWHVEHTGGSCSLSGMMHYPRIPISELHLGKFPDSMEFQSWKVNFKTAKTADLHLTLQWINEVEMAKSVGELVTSRSIVGRTRLRNASCDDCVCIEKTSRQAHSLSQESECPKSSGLKIPTDSYVGQIA